MTSTSPLEGHSQLVPRVQMAGHVPVWLVTLARTTSVPYWKEKRSLVMTLAEVYSIRSRRVRQLVESGS